MEVTNHAITHIRANYSNPNLSISDVAQKLHLSSGYLGKLFKEYLGLTFSDYLSDIRIEAAKGILLNTDEPIERVALLSGFNTSKYFYRIFRKKTQMTPREFRIHSATSTDMM